MFTDIRAKESLARLRSTCCQSEEQSFTAFIYRQAAPYGAISNSCGSTYRYPAGALASAPSGRVIRFSPSRGRYFVEVDYA
jgi:hypothetical protein